MRNPGRWDTRQIPARLWTNSNQMVALRITKSHERLQGAFQISKRELLP